MAIFSDTGVFGRSQRPVLVVGARAGGSAKDVAGLRRVLGGHYTRGRDTDAGIASRETARTNIGWCGQAPTVLPQWRGSRETARTMSQADTAGHKTPTTFM